MRTSMLDGQGEGEARPSGEFPDLQLINNNNNNNEKINPEYSSTLDLLAFSRVSHQKK